ncbi:MAG TPA: hypothetical protein VGV41_22965, partial [Pseudolabrys sp.]|uniref:hypothetical protein n=1 Tax=Pseudolabrys sp. TaxID=1960880 RepID=UPI002DDCBD9D
MRKKSRSSAFDSADKYDEEYLKAVYHSVELHEGRQKLERTVHDFLSFENRGAFKLTNAHSKRVWLRQLLPSFIEYNEAGVGWRKALDQGAVAVA